MVQISFQDLGVFLVLLVLAVAGIFLILTLSNVNKLVSGINRKMTENDQNVREILANVNGTTKNLNEIAVSLHENKHIFDEKIPQTINNIHDISATLKNTGDKVDRSLDVVNSSLVETATTVKDNTQDLLGYIRVVGEGIRILLEVFSKK